jgi:hypothetical protein
VERLVIGTSPYAAQPGAVLQRLRRVRNRSLARMAGPAPPWCAIHRSPVVDVRRLACFEARPGLRPGPAGLSVGQIAAMLVVSLS